MAWATHRLASSGDKAKFYEVTAFYNAAFRSEVERLTIKRLTYLSLKNCFCCGCARRQKVFHTAHTLTVVYFIIMNGLNSATYVFTANSGYVSSCSNPAIQLCISLLSAVFPFTVERPQDDLQHNDQSIV